MSAGIQDLGNSYDSQDESALAFFATPTTSEPVSPIMYLSAASPSPIPVTAIPRESLSDKKERVRKRIADGMNGRIFETTDLTKCLTIEQSRAIMEIIRQNSTNQHLENGEAFYSSRRAKEVENEKVHRYSDVSSYDDCQIDPSDYDNGSPIVLGDTLYYAINSPLENRKDHFLNTILFDRVHTVVTLSNIFEGSVKGSAWWEGYLQDLLNPSVVVVGDVESIRTSPSQQHVLKRTLRYHSHEFNQFHYCYWPDGGVAIPEIFLAMHHKVNESIRSQAEQPLVVHCSAGIGRTGTYIVLKHILDELEKKNMDPSKVPLIDIILRIRQCRAGLVQTPEQIQFISQVISNL